MALISMVLASFLIVSGRFTIGYLLGMYRYPTQGATSDKKGNVVQTETEFTDLFDKLKMKEMIKSSKEYNIASGPIIVHRIEAVFRLYMTYVKSSGSGIICQEIFHITSHIIGQKY